MEPSVRGATITVVRGGAGKSFANKQGQTKAQARASAPFLAPEGAKKGAELLARLIEMSGQLSDRERAATCDVLRGLGA